jgi:D-psicose/D-tagatose/L-ribulose 3-epimerase
MQYGAHIYLWTDRWSDSRLDVLDRARGLGLDYVEIAIGDDVEFTPRLTRDRAEALGLGLLVSPGGLWPVGCDISSPDPQDRRRGLAWHRAALDLAADLGAVAYAGAIYGHPGVVRTDRPPEECYRRTADGLAELAGYAAERGVRLVVEPMSRFRTHVANTPEQIMHLVCMAGHRNIGVALDTYHAVTEVRDYGEAVRVCGERLWAVHACENDRGVPGGGLVQWGALFEALAQVGFDGCIGLESYNTSLGDFALGRGIFQDVCPDGDAFVRQGLAFLRRVAERAPGHP